MLSPKILHDKSKQNIQAALVKFYTERPNYYGFCNQRDEEYKIYAEFIKKYCSKGVHLDFGTGTNRILMQLRRLDFDFVWGLDYFNDKDLDLLNSELAEFGNCKLTKYKEPNKIPFENASFDSISSLCVFEHLVYPEDTLFEMDRVLKKGGFLIIDCPNWSGPNSAITAIKYNLVGKRYWRYNSLADSVFAIFRSVYWYLQNVFSKNGKFIMIEPRMRDGEIDFEFSDDDVVHLCQPLSIIKFMGSLNYKLVYCNKNTGRTLYSRVFNKVFPMFATSNQIVLQKL